MRTLLVLSALLLVLPAAAYSAKPPPKNGTLSIREGHGVVELSARGSITGRLRGKITITDPNPYDAKRPVVYGSARTVYRGAKTTVYQGRNLRFRLIGALFRIRMDGRAIFLSAIGRGQGMIDGAGDIQTNLFYDGVWSLNDEPYHSLPDAAADFRLAAPSPAPG